MNQIEVRASTIPATNAGDETEEVTINAEFTVGTKLSLLSPRLIRLAVTSVVRRGPGTTTCRLTGFPLSHGIEEIISPMLVVGWPGKDMSFSEALRILNIEDFGDRIWRSNSHGELLHIRDYIAMAQHPAPQFRSRFLRCVAIAEQSWSRPESCFQHIPRLMNDIIEAEKMTP